MKVFQVDFQSSLEKLKSFKLTEMYKFDEFLYEMVDIVFDLIEIIEKREGTLTEANTESYIEELEQLIIQISELDKILAGMQYDSHAHDRFIHMFYSLWDDVEKELKSFGK